MKDLHIMIETEQGDLQNEDGFANTEHLKFVTARAIEHYASFDEGEPLPTRESVAPILGPSGHTVGCWWVEADA